MEGNSEIVKFELKEFILKENSEKEDAPKG
jgi:hypothetical protein